MTNADLERFRQKLREYRLMVNRSRVNWHLTSVFFGEKTKTAISATVSNHLG